VEVDPVLLFRYSALTWNSHRVHYDRPYGMVVEGYPGLVVHGPLIAILMLHAFLKHRPESKIKRFAFRAVKPIYDVAPFSVGGAIDGDRAASLFATDAAGDLCTGATLQFT
jgi:3-methylfumaryl-CoA hydratase